MKNKIIAIGREFGSGGREIGKQLRQRILDIDRKSASYYNLLTGMKWN